MLCYAAGARILLSTILSLLVYTPLLLLLLLSLLLLLLLYVIPSALVTASVVKSIVVSGMSSMSSLLCALPTRRCDSADVVDAVVSITACVLTFLQQSDIDILLSLHVQHQTVSMQAAAVVMQSSNQYCELQCVDDCTTNVVEYTNV
jgi:hypothetical protein